MELSEVFWTFLITSVIGLILAIVRYCYRSKCIRIDACGIHIQREVELETEIKDDIDGKSGKV